MRTHAELRERLRAAALAAFSMDEGLVPETEELLASLSARELWRLDGVARRRHVGEPFLGPAQRWTDRVIEHSETAAAIGSMHTDGFVRERALQRLVTRDGTVATRVLALRVLDHVPRVRAVAQDELDRRTSLQQATEIMPILEQSAGRRLGSRVRADYLDAICAAHGEQTVWGQLRQSSDPAVRRTAFRHSSEHGLLDHEDAVRELPHERDQVVRGILARLVADGGDVEAIRTTLLHSRAAEARVLGLLRLDAGQLPPADVERLLVDSSVLVRWWARRRWHELGHDARAACREAITAARSPAARARAYVGLVEAGATIDRPEVLELVDSAEPALRKVGLRLLAQDVRPEDAPRLFELVRSDHSRVARLASEALAAHRGTWSLEDVLPLKQDADPAMRRRGWWLHRGRGGWESVIADLETLRDPDDSVAKLGRSTQAPMYVAPSAEQQVRIEALLADAPLRREQKLALAHAAGLRETTARLRARPGAEAAPSAAEDGLRPRRGRRAWWRRRR